MRRLLIGSFVAGLSCLIFALPAWAGFGIAENGFQVSITNRDGTPDTQAGSHPFAFTTSLTLNEVPGAVPKQTEGGDPRNIETELPAGFVGDPGNVPACPAKVFSTPAVAALEGYFQVCPVDTQIGFVTLKLNGRNVNEPVYNIEPPQGEPAEFGFLVITAPVVLVPRVRTGGDYGVSVDFDSLPEAYSTIKGTLTLWGVPADPGHDSERAGCLAGRPAEENKGICPVSVRPKPFLTLPTSCTGPLPFHISVDSWAAPGVFSEASTTTPGMTGCNKLGFTPAVVAQPEPAEAASPVGLSVEVQVPQTYDDPAGLATANLKDTTVTLPAGVALNPSAGDGLAGCSEAQIGLHNADPPACPDASKVGSVQITTPLLPHPLLGGVYLAQQGNLPGNGSNPFGSLIAIYIAIEDPASGVIVKLAGEVKPDPVTGQLVTKFLDDPQVPFDSLKLSFYGGPRAALVSPPFCGSFLTSTDMSPWSGGVDVTPSSTFQITSGPQASACLLSEPFAPALISGVTSNQAGGFSPYSLTFYRTDAEQSLSRIQVKTPPGLLGMISRVALCGEPQAAQGACGPESEIGHVTVGVGAGSNPLYVTGKLFLTGSYDGAPYGLSIVVPAIAGPFDLGTVIVRAAVDVDQHTAVLTVTSDSLPQILQGIPLRVRAVNVTLDRKEFIFNPTTCDPLSVQAALSSSLGATINDSTHFQVTNCAALAFKPSLKVFVSGRTSRATGASLHVKLILPKKPFGSQANIAKVKVSLPKSLPSRLTTLQKACPAGTFDVNPASCSQASRVGFAEALTPVMPVPLQGPVYFVSHGGAAFPDLIVVLQGYGVRVDLVGSTFISKASVTSSTFRTVPDVPVGSFQLYLPQGKDSALAANGNLCRAKSLKMPTAFVAQDGAKVNQSTPIVVSGCGAKAARAARSKYRHRERTSSSDHMATRKDGHR